MALARQVKWKRSVEGFVESHCGRFNIYPEYQGTCSAQAYRLRDNETGKQPSGDTQRDMKLTAQDIVTDEYSAQRLQRRESATADTLKKS